MFFDGRMANLIKNQKENKLNLVKINKMYLENWMNFHFMPTLKQTFLGCPRLLSIWTTISQSVQANVQATDEMRVNVSRAHDWTERKRKRERERNRRKDSHLAAGL